MRIGSWMKLSVLFIFCFFFTILSTISLADQCTVLSRQQSSEAIKNLKKGAKIYKYCAPCGEGKADQVIVNEVQVIELTPERDFKLLLNNEEIDLAYVYIPVSNENGTYVNLANLSGCPVVDTPNVLPVSAIESYHDRSASKPEMASDIRPNSSYKEAPNLFDKSTADHNDFSNIEVSVQVLPEFFPILATMVANLNLDSGIINWKIYNKNSKSVGITLVSEIPEWTSPAIKTVEINPHERIEIKQNLFGNKLLSNNSIVPTTVILKATAGEKLLFQETKSIKVRPADDMVWSLEKPWDTKDFIAAWVTPKDRAVEQILSEAKEKLYDRSLSGYLQKGDITPQVRAIFNAVRDKGISYVNSPVNFGKIGFTQRVRLPRESIMQQSANCIDGAVLFASLFENIGLEPLIIMIPGHAFIGVRLAPGSQETLFIETTIVGRNPLDSLMQLMPTFDVAVQTAESEFNEAKTRSSVDPNALQIIDIKKLREAGIYPLWSE